MNLKLTNMNKEIMVKMGFAKQMELVEQKKCPVCGKDINTDDFRDGISIKEYGISGLCQDCQDDVFGK